MTTATETTVLKTAIATYAHTKGLKDGSVAAPGIRFDHVEVSPISGAFRRMCRGLEFDLCEMAITTYLTAKAYDKAVDGVSGVRSAHGAGDPSPTFARLGGKSSRRRLLC